MASPRRINLIPKEAPKGKAIKPSSLIAGLSGRSGIQVNLAPWAWAGVIVFIIGSASMVWVDRHSYTEKIEEIKAQKVEVDEKLKALAVTTVSVSALDQQRKLISEVLARKSAWATPLKELSLRVPTGVWLDDMKANVVSGGRMLEIVGLAESPAEVTDFFHALEESYSFKRVIMNLSERDDTLAPPMYRFKFSCPLDEVDLPVDPKLAGKSAARKVASAPNPANPVTQANPAAPVRKEN